MKVLIMSHRRLKASKTSSTTSKVFYRVNKFASRELPERVLRHYELSRNQLLSSRNSSAASLRKETSSWTSSQVHFQLPMPVLSFRKAASFVGSEMDQACFELAKAHTIRKAAFYAVNRTSDWSLSLKALHFAKGIQTTLRSALSCDPDWEALEGLPQYQRLPDHIIGYLGSATQDRSFFVPTYLILFHDWPSLHRIALEQADLDILLALDSGVYRVMVSKSTISHLKAGRGVFGGRTIQAREVICPLYGKLVYHDLHKRQAVRKTYGAGVLGVSVRRFIDFAVRISVPTPGPHFPLIPNNVNGSPSIWIVPAPFCVASFIKDPRYAQGDEEFGPNQPSTNQQRTPNCAISISAKHINDPSNLLPTHILNVVATQHISPGQELFMTYDNTDLFPPPPPQS